MQKEKGISYLHVLLLKIIFEAFIGNVRKLSILQLKYFDFETCWHFLYSLPFALLETLQGYATPNCLFIFSLFYISLLLFGIIQFWEY